MSGGRTSWYARDVARHRRALMVELKADHGPVALAVDDVLCAHAKEQNDAGEVRDGFAAVAQEAGCTRDQARQFICDAAELGWFDDLEVDQDGRRFRLRISGWAADQGRARGAWRQQRRRERLEAEPQPEHVAPSPPPAPSGDPLLDEVLQILTEPAKHGHEVIVDPGGMGVQNIIRAYPKYSPDEHLSIARRAAADLSDPGYRTRSAHRALDIAYRRHEERRQGIRGAAQGPKTGGVSPRDIRLGAKERRAAERDALRNGSLMTSTVEAEVIE